MKNTNLIAFSGGSYGTYLEWALTSLVDSSLIKDPRGDRDDDSHAFSGNHLLNMEGWDAYHNSSAEYKFARVHPKVKKEESLIENLDRLSKQSSKVINLYPDERTYLLVIHNYLYKSCNNLWDKLLLGIDRQDIYDGWGVDPGTNLERLPNWIKREYFSYNLFSSWEAQVEWYLPNRFSNRPNCQYLFVKDLLYDFENSLEKLQNYLDIEYVRPIQDLTEHHQTNLSRQRFINQQPVSESIIASILEQKNISWNSSELTIFTEAWIQRKLRENGFELKCHGLDTFPADSVQLSKLLY